MGSTAKGYLALPTEVRLVNGADPAKKHSDGIRYPQYNTKLSLTTSNGCLWAKDILPSRSHLLIDLAENVIRKSYGRAEIIDALTLAEHAHHIRHDVGFGGGPGDADAPRPTCIRLTAWQAQPSPLHMASRA